MKASVLSNFSVVAAALISGFWHTTVSAQTLIEDDFESGITQWSAEGTWGISTQSATAGGRSAADSPGGFYNNNEDASLTWLGTVDLSAVPRPAMLIHHRYFLENGFDFGRVELSLDGGSSWLPSAVLSVTGIQSDWQIDHIDLSSYASESDISIRFRLISDASVVMQGWFIDAVRLGNAPAGVTLLTPDSSAIGRNSVALNWTESTDADFSSYRVFRSRSPITDIRGMSPITVIDDVETVEFTDITAAPKTTYYYRVETLSEAGLRHLSNEVSGMTEAGMDYPFLDDGEGGPNTWIPTAPWALSDQYSYSGDYAWADSPYSNYENNIASQALTLAAPMDLSSAEQPVLSFVHRYSFASGDTGNVEISTNNGGSWSTLVAYSTGQTDWRRERHDLSSYTGAPSVLIRFRLTSDSTNNDEGWYIDDISVAEAPTTVPAPAIDDIASHSMRLTWTANTDPIFSHYAIHRSTSSSVNHQSTLAGIVTDPSVTSFEDTGLNLDTVYHYRVYAVSPYGTYSPASELTSSARTLNNPIPFQDDFSEGLDSWNLTGTWGLTDTHSHTGDWSLTDSPGTMHANNASSSATTAVDLRESIWPVLSFQERYHFGTGDRGYVSVSVNGTTWTDIYSVSGDQADWQLNQIDLSPYREEGNLRIRFTITSNNDSNVADGWYIDAVEVSEHPGGTLALPFRDDFSSGLDDWVTGGWVTREAVDAVNGSHILADTRNDLSWAHLYLNLGKEIDLTDASDPQLMFWYKGYWYPRHYLRLQVSANGGLSWANTTVVGSTSSTTVADWTRYQHSLQSYVGQVIRVRLVNINYYTGVTQQGRLDAFTIQERPEGVNQSAPIPSVRSVELNWTQSGISDFKRYEVYRHTSSNVGPQHTLVTSISDRATTNFTDTELSVGQSYYYSIFVVNEDEVYSSGAERLTTTVPVDFPFQDDLNDLNYWMPEGDWGILSGGGRDGGDALASNPVGDYPPSTNVSALTAIDLRGSQWPLLRFHELYDFGTGDRGYVEVSTNGTSWSELYAVSGQQDSWQLNEVDLSPYKNQDNLRIRFRIQANHDSSVGDGWFIDTVEVVEHAGGTLALPFRDDFSSGLDNWINGGWSTREASDAVNGSHVLADTRNDLSWAHLYLNLGKEIDLTDASDPQLMFWYKGYWYPRHYLRLQISADGGLSWTNTTITGSTSSVTVADWTRYQHSLQSYVGQVIRVRLVNINYYTGVTQQGRLDAFTIQERPEGVNQSIPVPSVRSVDLNWSQSAISNFERYEVYRHTSSNVGPQHTLVASIADPATTHFTDTGLSVGQSYYYSVFVVNEDQVYSSGAERLTTTVPVNFPFQDDLNNLNNWMPEGDWSILSGGGRDGSDALASNPVGDYPPSTNVSALTAIDLTGSQWPLLRFHEHYDFGSGDRGYVEVSTTGTSWSELYAVSGQQNSWQFTEIDLSPYKNQDNLRIRFRIQANHDSSVGDGWFIDAVEVVEHPGGTLALPFREDFSSGLDNWISGGWVTREADDAFKGSHVLADTQNDLSWADLYMNLGKEIDLTNATDPQLLFWYRGYWYPRHYLRLQVSSDGGLSWANTTVVGSTSSTTVADWTRYQHSLQPYVGQVIRVRLVNINYYTGVTQQGRLDAFTIQERPAGPVLYPAEDVSVAAISLLWNNPNIENFKAYRIYRSGNLNVSESSTLLAEITDPEQTQFTDTGLQAKTPYHYRIYAVNEDSVTSPSNTVSATTLAIEPPWTENFTADVEENWTLTGNWQVAEGLGPDGSLALVDSIGDYSPSSNTFAQTAVDLTSLNWPVIRFVDRYHLGSGDYVYLEVSTNDGSSWSTIYSARDHRTEWAEQFIDLSPYRNAESVWLRWRLQSNSDSSVGNGWRIHEVEVFDNTSDPIIALVDAFDFGTEQWLSSNWQTHEGNPYTGNASIRDNPWGSQIGEITLTYAEEIDLSEVDEPLLTYWLRAQTSTSYSFAAQISSNGGLSWTTLPGTSFSNTTIAEWTRYQLDLSAYKDTPIRLRFRSFASSWRSGWVDLDRIGLGSSAPGQPELVSPFYNETVEVFRPELVINNAIDYQNETVNYQFEVYADSQLENLVAQVPTVAAGAIQTRWQVDVNLPDNAAYWWRARAFKGDLYGDWTEPSVFNVNEMNNPPYPVVVVGPPNGSNFYDLTTRLLWYPTTDPDVGDTILDYQIQIARDTQFDQVVADLAEIDIGEPPAGSIASIALSSLLSSEQLDQGNYYWRIRARDSRFSQSEWSQTRNWLTYPSKLTLWRNSLFDHGDFMDADLSGPLADTNDDGIPNLIKFLHSGSPFSSHENDRPRIERIQEAGETYISIVFALRRDHGLQLRFEASDDGIVWQSTTGSFEIIEEIDAETDWVRFREDTPTSNPRRMLRIRAASNDGFIAYSIPVDPEAGFILTVNSTSGGTVEIEPLEDSYIGGSQVLLTAQPEAGFTFTGWTGDIVDTNNPLTVTINSDLLLTANFRALVQPVVITISEDSSLIDGESATLSVQASGADLFQWYVGESGDTSNPIVDEIEAEFTVNSDEVGSYWVRISSNDGLSANSDTVTVSRAYTVTVDSAQGGTASMSPDLDRYDADTAISIAAIPESGYLFSGWTGSIESTENPLRFTISEDMSVFANFTAIPVYTVDLQVQGAGQIYAFPAATEYLEGSQVTFTALPAGSYSFDHWLINGAETSGNNPLVQTITSNLNLLAVFRSDSLTLDSSGAEFGYAGAGHFFQITGERSWTIETQADWIQFSIKTGSGSANVEFTVGENYGPARTATVWINNIAYTVEQDGTPFNTLFDPCDNRWTHVIDDHWRYSRVHGFIYTEHYPWVLTLVRGEIGIDGWWRIHEDGADYESGYYFYHPESETWYYTGAEHYPEVYVIPSE
ncbi:MAG: hypothetical protein JJU20_01645 [Opitutales bacterium]|nr:hypothetical protein [Opitutales bacterium]